MLVVGLGFGDVYISSLSLLFYREWDMLLPGSAQLLKAALKILHVDDDYCSLE